MSKETGGQAFPRQQWEYDGHNNVLQYQEDGMTLRDYFAAKAMQVMVSIYRGNNPSSACEQAYVWADAMLKARNKQ
ncbi:hypothetical protein ACLECR_14445 [Lonsdalea quercina]|uniref:hypothetical protein n=1 Tax=Lonsdalea quercina TaxID=71657 RepID=UPI003975D380